ncbi:universal stress protein [Ilumatobacter sp.]|uniref:universal stress protein n=1 Tax=Ilumatobacter sp. TaxID=1967498 RepID=UPI0037528E13
MNTDSNQSTPTGAETLMSILDEATEQGYETQQIGRTGGRIECTSCSQHSPAASYDVQHMRRLEGASDAADLLLVLWSPCPSCQQRGVLILGYGPNASKDDTAILQHLDLDGADPSPINMPKVATDHANANERHARPQVNVLIGVDETPESRGAVETAWELFGSNGVYTIVCINERQPFVVGSLGVGTSLAGMYAHLDDSIGQQLATNAASSARSAAPVDADINFHTDVGHAGSSIIDAAEEHDSDLIVIGSHDRGFWERVFSPSVGKYLVENASCPVLVVRSAST